LRVLRTFIFADTLILTLLGLGKAFIHPGLPPVVYLEISKDTVPMELGALVLSGLSLVLWLSTDLPLIADRRRLALGLGFANLLMAALSLLQWNFGGAYSGLFAVIFLGLAAGLAWTGLRSRGAEETAAEIAALKIPDEIRQGLLRQIEEAAAQEERNRLARDLHDSIKQQLFSINVGTAAAQERWERDPEGARKALVDVRRSAREAMVEMQAMLHQLRPEALSTTGLIEALREQCEALGYRSGAEVTMEVGDPIPDERLPPGAQETLFRLAQEMLANVARHSRASRARLWLGRESENVALRIEDDGQGFNPSAEVSGMGLRNLRERAAALRGTLEIASAPGSGATLTVRIPLALPPLPEAADRRREILAEFLCMVTWGELFAATAFLDSADWIRVAVALSVLTTGLIAWLVGRPFRRKDNGLIGRKTWVFLSLYLSWWWIALAKPEQVSDPEVLWSPSLVAFLYAAAVLVWLHRTSRLRPFWRRGNRFWLGLILPVEAGVLLALETAISKPRPLALNAAEAGLLLVMALSFPYTISRQRRIEGGAQ
jgi:signal transduction histidine kinase